MRRQWKRRIPRTATTRMRGTARGPRADLPCQARLPWSLQPTGESPREIPGAPVGTGMARTPHGDGSGTTVAWTPATAAGAGTGGEAEEDDTSRDSGG
mmetsp:Transcript_112951/g.258697  ORF Transcript_112951/g.258697 Transcript_112951/m.258697 type:complete len:98 (-) Transcript_112951:26-319(-)